MARENRHSGTQSADSDASTQPTFGETTSSESGPVTTMEPASVAGAGVAGAGQPVQTGLVGVAVTAADDRFKLIKDPDNVGQPAKRIDFIRRRWAQKFSRGAIAKELTAINSVANGGDGKKVPYQIVFAATKGVPGGPDKAPVAVVPATPVADTPASAA
jgi:hypothetical protein